MNGNNVKMEQRERGREGEKVRESKENENYVGIFRVEAATVARLGQ